MSSVQDFVNCTQCGYGEADFVFHCATEENQTRCRRCGYSESWDATRDNDGEIVGLEHTVTGGLGSLWYRSHDNGVFCQHCLLSEEDISDASKWLQQALADGAVDRQTAYLARWCSYKKQVEMVIGAFFEWPKGENDVANAREHQADFDVSEPDGAHNLKDG